MKKTLNFVIIILLVLITFTACKNGFTVDGEEVALVKEEDAATLYAYKDYQLLIQNSSDENTMVQFFNENGDNIYNCYAKGKDLEEKITNAVEMYENRDEVSKE